MKQFALCVGNLEEVIEHNLSAMRCSLELRSGVVVPLECSVDNLGAHVDHIGHDGLVLRTVPSNVPWLSVSVSVGGSVVLMVHRGLSGSPLSVCIGYRWVSWQDLCQVPVEQVWVVDQRLGVEGVIVHHDGSRVAETSSETTGHEVNGPGISQPASNVEVLDGEFSNEEETEQAAELGARSVVGPVKVRAVNWAGDNALHVVAREPASQLIKMNQDVFLR